ncbi:hypothetical protein [Sphingomonas sp.]|uniref:hypothetical protein n=1 Tax=Sphingomonas sp. TaxID=28214 RepID=UPI003D6CC71D
MSAQFLLHAAWCHTLGVALLLPAIFVGDLAYWASGWNWVRDMRETTTFGWLKRWVDVAAAPTASLSLMW